MNRSLIKLLVIDEDQSVCAAVREALLEEGYIVDFASDSQTALKLIGVGYNLVLVDDKMSGPAGLPLLPEIKKKNRDSRVITMTAAGAMEAPVESIDDPAIDFLAKPLDLRRLPELVARALQSPSVSRRKGHASPPLKSHSEPSLLLGRTSAVRKVAALADDVAESDVTVLIEGESGTGKEIVARTIHARSSRRDKPFITVNCAALAEQLLEAELFGHVKGAFTGALNEKMGRFQLADGGTLFLDEIGDLSAKGQGDLLRVLDDGTFRMVGGTKLIHVDVRVVAATNKNLQQAVAKGQFREDLFYRLQIVPIFIPPLRERAEDIPLLMDSFLVHFAKKHNRRPKHLVAEAMQLCQRYSWPGNVRQLRNVAERLVITCKTTAVGIDDLPEFLREHDQAQAEIKIAPGMSLAEAEKLLIRLTLTHATANREEAAKLLGISRRTLQYKLNKYGLL